MAGTSFLNKISILLFIFLASLTGLALSKGTRLGFYTSTCPNVEFIVQSTVQSGFLANPRIASGLLRMFFHDCFVDGCDASILINGPSSEKTAVPNLPLQGFEVIDAAKSRLETICPGVVSCADILALAARDSVVLSGGIRWEVPMGRRDGLISQASHVANLPAPNDPISVQIRKFAEKKLNIQDLVTLVEELDLEGVLLAPETLESPHRKMLVPWTHTIALTLYSGRVKRRCLIVENERGLMSKIDAD